MDATRKLAEKGSYALNTPLQAVHICHELMLVQLLLPSRTSTRQNIQGLWRSTVYANVCGTLLLGITINLLVDLFADLRVVFISKASTVRSLIDTCKYVSAKLALVRRAAAMAYLESHILTSHSRSQCFRCCQCSRCSHPPSRVRLSPCPLVQT